MSESADEWQSGGRRRSLNGSASTSAGWIAADVALLTAWVCRHAIVTLWFWSAVWRFVGSPAATWPLRCVPRDGSQKGQPKGGQPKGVTLLILQSALRIE
jgi:hypothetical protein